MPFHQNFIDKHYMIDPNARNEISEKCNLKEMISETKTGQKQDWWSISLMQQFRRTFGRLACHLDPAQLQNCTLHIYNNMKISYGAILSITPENLSNRKL